MTGPWKPSRPSEWGTGGVQPADWEGIDTEPFAADPPSRELEEAPEPPPTLPGRCVITCVTPVYARRRGLVVKHGEGWLERTACPICGERATVELARPVMDCDECGGSGHVAHLETGEPRAPGVLRLALGQVRELFGRRRENAQQGEESGLGIGVDVVYSASVLGSEGPSEGEPGGDSAA